MQDPKSTVEAVWHFSEDGQTRGPITIAQLEKMILEGQIDAQTFVWTHGFSDWLPAGKVDRLRSLFDEKAFLPTEENESVDDAVSSKTPLFRPSRPSRTSRASSSSSRRSAPIVCTTEEKLAPSYSWMGQLFSWLNEFFGFQHFTTLSLIKIAYPLGVLVIGIWMFRWGEARIEIEGANYLLEITLAVGAFLVLNIFWRIICETLAFTARMLESLRGIEKECAQIHHQLVDRPSTPASVLTASSSLSQPPTETPTT